MAKSEEKKVRLSEVSIRDLVAYKEMADLMFEHYYSWSRSFLGEYDPVTKANYETALQMANYYRDLREAVRREMENRLNSLEEAGEILTTNWERPVGNEETVD